jgi:hypothetical protein
VRKSLTLALGAPAVLLMFALAGLTPAFAQQAPQEASDSSLSASVLLPAAAVSPAPADLPAAAFPALPAASAPAPQEGVRSSPRIGIGVFVGSLGVGGQVAVRVLGPLNVRAGFSGLGIGYNFNNDGINYAARVRLEGAPATADFFFFHGIHLSGGALLYNGTQVTGTATVSSGQTFTLNDVSYESSAASPLAGSVGVTFRKAAPLAGIGFGNLVPRKGHHWSITADFDVAYSGSPRAALSLTGLACAPGKTSGSTCLSAATDPTIQSNIIGEQASINSKMHFFKIYPVMSLGFGYAF